MVYLGEQYEAAFADVAGFDLPNELFLADRLFGQSHDVADGRGPHETAQAVQNAVVGSGSIDRQTNC